MASQRPTTIQATFTNPPYTLNTTHTHHTHVLQQRQRDVAPRHPIPRRWLAHWIFGPGYNLVIQAGCNTASSWHRPDLPYLVWQPRKKKFRCRFRFCARRNVLWYAMGCLTAKRERKHGARRQADMSSLGWALHRGYVRPRRETRLYTSTRVTTWAQFRSRGEQ